MEENELRIKGVLGYTLPNKPKSKNQRIYTIIH